MINICSSSHNHFKCRNDFTTGSTIASVAKQPGNWKRVEKQNKTWIIDLFSKHNILFSYRPKLTLSNLFCRASNCLWYRGLNPLRPGDNHNSHIWDNPHATAYLKLVINIGPVYVCHSRHTADCHCCCYYWPPLLYYYCWHYSFGCCWHFADCWDPHWVRFLLYP